MRKKIHGWSTKCLSRAGKAVLLRNVAQAIPTYSMSCFLLPKSLCVELQRMMNSFWWGSGTAANKGIKWLSWENMSMSKAQGGMGFRDLHGFNLALLGKHCGNFLQNPNSLVSRVFKARYFPNTSLLNASKGEGSSFIWSGIWQAKETLKHEFRWVLGDGKSIEVFKDAWLRGKDDYRVDSGYANVEGVVKASDLFVSGAKSWDTQMVNDLFLISDAKAILATPIPQTQVCDRIAWNYSTTGLYSVKTGYQVWLNSLRSNFPQNAGWKKIWKVDVPHKVRIFLWRFGRNNIPVRNLLRGRGVPTTIMCPMCNSDVEHLAHLFLDCGYAKECWDAAGLSFNTDDVEDIPGWFIKLLNDVSNEVQIRIAEVLWSIWTARNQKVWEQKQIPAKMALEWSMKHIGEWQMAQRKKAATSCKHKSKENKAKVRWSAPKEGTYKLNVDASVFKGEGAFSVGLVLRDHKGVFIEGKTIKIAGEVPVLEAETRGVLEAFQWLCSRSMGAVEVECDSMLTVNAINRETSYYLEVDTYLKECTSILSSRSEFSLAYVNKHANKVAHMLARVPCLVNDSILFLSPPAIVLETLLYDAILDE